MPIEEGKSAPTFTLPDAEGRPLSLRDLRGKFVVLYFYSRFFRRWRNLNLGTDPDFRNIPEL